MLEIVLKIQLTILPFALISAAAAAATDSYTIEKIAKAFIVLSVVTTLMLTTVFVWGWL